MPAYTDQTGRTVHIAQFPSRIVSLVPSQTELLHALGLTSKVVGITKFCVHPSGWFRTKTKVGGTKNIDLARIRALKPDLIIANKEENLREQVTALWDEFPVWVTDVQNLPDAVEMIRGVGTITGRAAKADDICLKITTGLSALHSQQQPLAAAYLIWRNPYMAIGCDTFIHHMLQHAGFQNVFADHKRYPAITVAELAQSGCKLVLLASEPYPFKEKHLQELQQQLPGVRCMLVDGELFSWYGSRLLQAPAYFKTLREQINAGLQ